MYVVTDVVMLSKLLLMLLVCAHELVLSSAMFSQVRRALIRRRVETDAKEQLDRLREQLDNGLRAVLLGIQKNKLTDDPARMKTIDTIVDKLSAKGDIIDQLIEYGVGNNFLELQIGERPIDNLNLGEIFVRKGEDAQVKADLVAILKSIRENTVKEFMDEDKTLRTWCQNWNKDHKDDKKFVGDKVWNAITNLQQAEDDYKFPSLTGDDSEIKRRLGLLKAFQEKAKDKIKDSNDEIESLKAEMEKKRSGIDGSEMWKVNLEYSERAAGIFIKALPDLQKVTTDVLKEAGILEV